MQQPAAAPRRPAPPMRQPVRSAAEQGPLEWLVPFVPPFLRVNRDTRTALVASLQSLSLPALGAQLAAFLQAHGGILSKIALIGGVWLYGLAWTDRNAPEFTVAYVILTGLCALMVHLYSGDHSAANGDSISAYSVFNKGGARMLGSLSAEQFENEIRHHLPDHGNGEDGTVDRNGNSDSEEEEENDPDLLLAMQLSLQEKKREDRRARRATKRR